MGFTTLGLYAFTAAVAGASPLPTGNVVWTSEPAVSKATLTVPYLLLAHTTATIPVESGTVVTSESSITPVRVDLRFASAALTTGDPKRDADLRSDRFFDVARYPVILFSSDEIVATNANTFSIKGTLTMHGASHVIMLDGHSNAEDRTADGRRHIRYEATGSFRRTDFGMTFYRGIVGNDVTLDVVIEATAS
ncbi:MAG TPA: YceI family protein [Candidatus Elarobacter sp.]|jgi:polyisoprenoid-binding protein YceI|nr:YceI family protein [Candidatus Elarobacter sp.]